MALRRSAREGYRLLLRHQACGRDVTNTAALGQLELLIVPKVHSQANNAIREFQQRWRGHSQSTSRPFQSWSAAQQIAQSPASTSHKKDDEQKDQPKSPLQHQKEVSSSAPSATPGAQLCDAILDRLRATKTKVDLQGSTGEVTYRQRLITIKNALISGTMVIVKFLFNVPGAIMRHLALPWADKVKVYQGWWVAIKKEAKHYWVSTTASSRVYLLHAWPNCQSLLTYASLTTHQMTLHSCMLDCNPQLDCCDKCRACTTWKFTCILTMQVGFKLLAADIRIASRLIRRVLQGKSLTRCAGQRTSSMLFAFTAFLAETAVPTVCFAWLLVYINGMQAFSFCECMCQTCCLW